eukprot:428171_1
MNTSQNEKAKQQQLPANDVSTLKPKGAVPRSPRRSPRWKRNNERAPGYEPPTIKKALEFRKLNMPHRVKAPNQPTGYRLARIGEKNALGEPAKLYGFCNTGPKHLDEFGIGIGLYFRQLYYLAVVFGVCVLVYICSIIHNQGFNELAETPTWLQGTVHGAHLNDLKWTRTGIPDIIVVVILLLFSITAKKAEGIAITAIDESQQTPQDYSICVHNPPFDFIDPDSYHRQYSKYGDIVFVTVILNNGELLKKITQKRVIHHKLKVVHATDHQTSLSSDGNVNHHESKPELPWWKRMLQPFGFF